VAARCVSTSSFSISMAWRRSASVAVTSIPKPQKALVADGGACHRRRTDAPACVFFCLFLFPLPFLLWFGAIPLWVNRRLKRVGIEVMGRCGNVSVSEGRYSTSFEFVTESGAEI
jgi:hypothetical protein